MPIPITFSPPGETFTPSIEDALRDGVLLVVRSDNVLRKAFSYDDDDPTKGVRIFGGVAHVDPRDGRIVVPQLIGTVAIPSNSFRFSTSKAGEKSITIALTLLESPDTGYLDFDSAAPQLTPETKLARMESSILRGTLYIDGQTSNRGKIVDPYRTPILQSGLYDPARVRFLNELAPDIRRSSPVPLRRKTPDPNEEFLPVDPVKDIAVAYGLLVTYTVTVNDREDMSTGGFSNG